MPLAGRVGPAKYLQLATVDEAFQNVLLNAEVIVRDRLETFTQEGQILHCCLNAVIIDIVGRRLGPQQRVITDVALERGKVLVFGASQRSMRSPQLDLPISY